MKDLKNAGTSFLQEFKKFAMRGNVIDMAIGVVVGTAFSKIVSSLVADVIMPILGVIVGSVDFKDLAITLRDKTETQEAVILNYGAFIQTVFDFLLIALSIFIAMKVIINIQKRFIAQEDEAKAKDEAAAAATASFAIITRIVEYSPLTAFSKRNSGAIGPIALIPRLRTISIAGLMTLSSSGPAHPSPGSIGLSDDTAIGFVLSK